MEQVIFYNSDLGYGVWTFIDGKDGEKELNRIKKSIKNDLALYRSHAINYPDRNNYWENRILDGGLQLRTVKIGTYAEFLEIQRKDLLGKGIHEITEEQYEESLCCLPPLKWEAVNGVDQFCMSEFWSGDYTSQYGKYKGHFFSKMVEFHDSTTYLSNLTAELDEIIKGA